MRYEKKDIKSKGITRWNTLRGHSYGSSRENLNGRCMTETERSYFRDLKFLDGYLKVDNLYEYVYNK